MFRRQLFTKALCLLTVILISVPPASAVDPATIGLIATLAKSLLDLYSNEGKKLDDISSKLDQFGVQLQSIDAKIEKIQKSFDEMKVYIGDEFDNQQRIETLSTIDVITESYRGWTKGLTNGPNSPQAELARLQHATRNLMRRSTYGNSTVIALAMSYERDMGVLTKENSEFRNQAFKAYLSYFRNALNPTDSGSLTARRIAASERMQSIEKDLAARQPLYWTAQQTWCLRTGEGIYRNDEVHIMTGTLDLPPEN
jgi:hypothetical protein